MRFVIAVERIDDLLFAILAREDEARYVTHVEHVPPFFHHRCLLGVGVMDLLTIMDRFNCDDKCREVLERCPMAGRPDLSSVWRHRRPRASRRRDLPVCLMPLPV